MKHAWMLAVLFAAAPVWTALAADEAWRSGIGLSILENPKEAGREAATAARKAFGEGEPKIVIVAAAIGQVVPGLVEGVAEHFPREIIYGSEVAVPLTPETNFPDAEELDILAGVAVLALGGDIEVATAFESTAIEGTDNPYHENGRRLGAALLPAVEASTRPGKLVLTFGNQHTGSNEAVVSGLQEALGGTVPIVGGAAGSSGKSAEAKEIVKGEIVTAYNVAILFAGRFRLGLAMGTGQHKPATADKAMEDALAQGDGAEPMFAFIFDCRRRRQEMMEENALAEEHGMFLKHMGSVPFFGFYGPGEIGTTGVGEPVIGTRFTVTTAVLFPVNE